MPAPRPVLPSGRAGDRRRASARPWVAVAAAVAAAVTSLRGDVTLPGVFSDHAVLLRSDAVPVWGWAQPGEEVTVEIAGRTARTTADAGGRWRASLDLAGAAPGPFELVVEGRNRVVARDVLVGETWLASGQSNMDHPLRLSLGAAEEIARSDNPQLRLFKMRRLPSLEPLSEFTGQWLVANPATAGRFTGVGYFFGQQLQRTLRTPVGLIDPSIGGSPVEAWISNESVAADPALRAGRDRRLEDLATHPERLPRFRADFVRWQRETGREDRRATEPSRYAAPGAEVAGWLTIQLPAVFTDVGLPDSGAVWLRRTVPVSAAMAGRPLRLDLGALEGYVEVYWDGEKIGETTVQGNPGLESRFTYEIPARLVREGEATLAARVFSPAGGAAIRASAAGSNFRVILDGNHRVFLAGEWRALVEFAFPPLPAAAPAAPREPNAPGELRGFASTLFNGQLHPLIPYAVRGCLWYQGEGNVDRAAQYRASLPRLIDDWRRHWRQPRLPFYFCQLPNFGPHSATPGESAWAELRESQDAALAVPDTGMAVLLDVGEEADLHPRDKRTPGERLARLALARTYGQPVPCEGPRLAGLAREGAALRLRFTHTDGGLVARPLPATYQPRSTDAATRPLPRHVPGSQLEGFAVCGADGRWVWADASIDGDTVLVRAAGVESPTAVRYAWSDNPVCNLYNGAGLPAAPFRTDRQPLSTRDGTY